MLSPRHAPDTRRAKVQKTGTGSTIEKQYTNKNKKKQHTTSKKRAGNRTKGKQLEYGDDSGVVKGGVPSSKPERSGKDPGEASYEEEPRFKLLQTDVRFRW